MVKKIMDRAGLQYTPVDRIILGINTVLLSLAGMIFLVPLINVVSSSLSSSDMVISGKVWLLPREFSLNAYKEVLSTPAIGRGYYNSLYYTIVGTTVNIIVTLLAAYPLSRKELVGRGAIMAIFTFTMFFSGGIIPSFLVVKSLGLLNTRMSQILPGALTVMNVIIARTYFQANIPKELYESAALDGASDNQVLLRIVLPLSKPIIAVLTLYYAVGHWNSFFGALLYLNSRDLYPIQIILRDYLMAAMENIDDEAGVEADKFMANQEVFKYALIVVGSIPVIVLYPFIQQYFTKGVMIGSLKG